MSTFAFGAETPPPRESEPTAAFSPLSTEGRFRGLDRPVDPMVGREVGGYRVLREIARGGMGVVYEAVQPNLGRRVALKMIRAGRLASPDEISRFRAEAEAAGKLDHPNLVPIFEVGEHEGQFFYAMKLIDGSNLARRGPDYRDDPAAAARLVATTARAVAAAHRAGVLHRDLKPANVLVDRLGQPHVTDFGLATQLAMPNGLTATGVALGTPGYAPPELAEGRKGPGSIASDVYGLGAILYELLTGRAPFVGDTIMETLRQVARAEPVAPDRLDPRVDRDLATITLKCLRKEPDRRYATADDLADDLGRWLDGRPILARPATRREKLAKWVRREPLVAGLALAVVLLALLGAGLSSWQWWVAVGQRDQARRAGQRLEAELLDRRDEAYATGTVLAHHRYGKGDIGRVHAALEAMRPEPGAPDPRGFEWYYLHKLCHASRLAIRPGEGCPYGIAYSPDGQTLATAHHDGAVAVLDARTGAIRRVLRGHKGIVRAVTFHPGGRLLASVGFDRMVRVWDLETGAERFAVSGIEEVLYWAAFSPDGDRLAIAGHDRCQVYRLSDGEASIVITHPGGIRAVAFSPDGSTLATCGLDGTIRLLDVRSPGPPRPLREFGGHEDAVHAIDFSRDGTRIVSASRDGTARVWSVAEGRELFAFRGHEGHVYAAAFHPGGEVVASVGFDRVVRLWDARTGKALRELRGHHSMLTGVAFRPDGLELATCGHDGTARVWDAGASPESRVLAGHDASVWGVAFGPGGRQVVSGGHDGYVRAWDAASGRLDRQIGPLPSAVNGVAVSPDGSTIVVACRDGKAYILDAGSGATRSVLDPGTGQDELREAAFTPDGRRIVLVGIKDPNPTIWDAATGRLLLTLRGDGAGIDCVAVSPDGRALATGHDGGLVQTWDAVTGARLLAFRAHRSSVHGLAFSPDGRRIASAGRDGLARVWDADTGSLQLSLENHDGYVLAVAFSPDGRRIATGGEDRTTRLWNAISGRELLSLRGHSGPVDALAFAPDGQRLVTAGGDATLRVWDAPPESAAHARRDLSGPVPGTPGP